MQSLQQPSGDPLAPPPFDEMPGSGGLNEKGRIHGKLTIYKFDARDGLDADQVAEAWKLNHDDPRVQPYEVTEAENGFLNSGITALWNLFIGAASVPFNAANSVIGIGDNNTAFSATQTDLLATTNKWYQAPDATYPSVSGQTVTLQVTVASGNANYQWWEFVWKNTAITPTAICLDRAVQNLGTKALGTAWVLLFAATIT